MAAMLHGRNNTILFLWDTIFILKQNIFIVPAMQHGRQAKPLLHIYKSKCYVSYKLTPWNVNKPLFLFSNIFNISRGLCEKFGISRGVGVYFVAQFWKISTGGWGREQIPSVGGMDNFWN